MNSHDTTVSKVTHELGVIEKLINIIDSKTASEFGVFSPEKEVTIDCCTLDNIRLRLYDLRDFYNRATVDIPFIRGD